MRNFAITILLVATLGLFPNVSMANNAIECTVLTENLSTQSKEFRAYTRWGADLRKLGVNSIAPGKSLLQTLDLFLSKDNLAGSPQSSGSAFGLARVQIQNTRSVTNNEGRSFIQRGIFMLFGFSADEFTKADATLMQNEFRRGALRHHEFPERLSYALTYMDMNLDYEVRASDGFGASFVQNGVSVGVQCKHCFFPKNCSKTTEFKGQAKGENANFVWHDLQEIK